MVHDYVAVYDIVINGREWVVREYRTVQPERKRIGIFRMCADARQPAIAPVTVAVLSIQREVVVGVH
jgi:hypothetical protein